MNIPYRPIALTLLTLAFSGALFQRAQAGGSHYFAPVTDAVVREECGSCHLAFPPSMLPASSWQRMMGSLKNHFGDDASVEAARAEQITRYLVANAGDTGGQRYGSKLLRGVSSESAPQRITELPKWIGEHRKIASAEWNRPNIKTKSNCVACHKDAERGYYDE